MPVAHDDDNDWKSQPMASKARGKKNLTEIYELSMKKVSTNKIPWYRTTPTVIAINNIV